MKKIVSGADAIINLALVDSEGETINLYDPEVIQSLEIKVYTKQTEEANKIIRNSLEQLENNNLKLQSQELDGLARGQILIDLYIVFACEDFSDGRFDYRKKISTNIILV